MSASPRVGAGRLVPAALLALALLGGPGHAEEVAPPVRRNEPGVGYVHPAGAQVGTACDVVVGGQHLRDARAVLFSGEGVAGSVLFWAPPPRPLGRAEAEALRRRLLDLAARAGDGEASRRRGPSRGDPAPAQEATPLPDHPMLRDLEQKSVEELEEVARYFFRPRDPLQRKRAIEESLRLRVRVAPDAAPGMRELRVLTDAGLSNPLRFRVGLLPEVREREPLVPGTSPPQLLVLPVTVNGQILPRDEDRFRFHATRGERILIQAEARGLVPFQADAVPGWMQATLAVLDPSGREVAFADDHGLDPDPVLFLEVPEEGEYVLVVRDALARGRDDFVYRVTIGALPFVRRIFPLGGRKGDLVSARLEGWNLTWNRAALDTSAVTGRREVAWRQGAGRTNEVAYAVDALPEVEEAEPNDQPQEAMALVLPRIVNGRIAAPGDVDWYAFGGRAGEEVVVEVIARRLGSPLDGLLRLQDEKGNVLAWNDDHAPLHLGVRGVGLHTHHADPYLRVRLPRSGTWTVRLSDAAGAGGEDHAYRLRIGPPRPDVDLYVSPSSVNVPAGGAALVTLWALRKDGFDGEVDVEIADPPPGFSLGGARIPAGRDRVDITLTAPAGEVGPRRLELTGRVRLGRKPALRTVTPADDVMQAFLWRHLVPAQELRVAVVGGGRQIPSLAFDEEDGPLVLRRGGMVRARFRSARRLPVADLRFVTVDAPEGVSLGAAKATHDGFTLEVRAAQGAQRTGAVDNLIVEAFVEREIPGRGGAAPQRRRFSLGHLPAIPYVIRRR